MREAAEAACPVPEGSTEKAGKVGHTRSCIQSYCMYPSSIVKTSAARSRRTGNVQANAHQKGKQEVLRRQAATGRSWDK